MAREKAKTSTARRQLRSAGNVAEKPPRDAVDVAGAGARVAGKRSKPGMDARARRAVERKRTSGTDAETRVRTTGDTGQQARIGRPVTTWDPAALTQAHLAALFRVTPVAVGKWDCPRNVDRTYTLSDVVAWHLDRAREQGRVEGAKSREGDRWSSARAELKQIELARERGRLVNRADVLKQVRTMIAALKARLLQIPAFVAPRAENRPAPVVLRLVEDAVCGALQELSEGLT